MGSFSTGEAFQRVSLRRYGANGEFEYANILEIPMGYAKASPILQNSRV
jgi:hypothetical protein